MAKFISCKAIPVTIMKHLLRGLLDEMGINNKAGTPLAKTLMAMQ